ncbi:MAG: hypothetical protein ACHQ2Y_06185 [Candidatus Lutacidiplasmatales archaeon]
MNTLVSNQTTGSLGTVYTSVSLTTGDSYYIDTRLLTSCEVQIWNNAVGSPTHGQAQCDLAPPGVYQSNLTRIQIA